MILTRNKINMGIEKISMYVADADQNILCAIPSHFIYDLNVKTILNAMDEGTFKLYRFYTDTDGVKKEFEGFNAFTNFNTIKVDNFGWFCLFDINDRIDSSGYQYKDIALRSLEFEFTRPNVYANDTTKDDTSIENMYRVYAPNDQEHSCLHKALKDLPHWKVGYVSPNVSSSYHDFTSLFDVKTAYEFLTTTMSESFDCVCIFDTNNRTVSVYKADDPEITIDSNVWFDYNTIKSFTKQFGVQDIVTCITVEGGEDGYSGGTLGIQDVNAGLNNELTNFEWVKQFWTESTRNGYNAYLKAYADYVPIHEKQSNLLTKCYLDYEQLNNFEAQEGVWEEYGLSQLEVARDAKLAVISSFTSINSNISKDEKDKAAVDYNTILGVIESKKRPIELKKQEIQSIIDSMSNNRPNIRTYMSEKNIMEMMRYRNVAEYKNDSIRTFSTDTIDDVLKAQKELKAYAEKELEEQCQPTYEIKIEANNLLAMKEFDCYNEQIKLGLLCHIDYDMWGTGKYHLYVRILEIDFNDLNGSNPSITFVFSNKSDLTQDFRLKELQKQVQSSSTSLNYNMNGIKKSEAVTSSLIDYMNTDRNLSKQRLINSVDEDVVVGEHGILLRKKLESGTYSDEQTLITSGQIGMTSDKWQTIDISIGRVLVPTINGTTVTYDGTYSYGVNAKMLVGEQILSSNLAIINKSGNFSITDNGLVFNGENHSVKINPNNPTSIIEINSGTDKIFYIDATTKKLTMSGTIKASDIVGGSIDIGSGNFKVDSSGKMTATNANISGDISGSTITGSSFRSDGIGGRSMQLNDGLIHFNAPNGDTATVSSGGVTLQNGENYAGMTTTQIITNGLMYCNNLRTSKTGGVSTNYLVHQDTSTAIKINDIITTTNYETHLGGAFTYKVDFELLKKRVSALEGK